MKVSLFVIKFPKKCTISGHARNGIFSASRNCVQILATWGRALSRCNMMWWSWMNGTTMGLGISSRYLCVFKMPSIKYACPYHNLKATMSHSIHNLDIRKPLTHTMPYTLSAICPVQWKPGFICEENISPKCQTPSDVSICPLKSVAACSLKTCDICGIVLCDKTAHFRVAFYCGQPKAHLCNNHAV